MKVLKGHNRACRYVIAILLETAYVLILAGLALLVAHLAQVVVR